MEAELEKFRQKKQAEERNLLIKEKIQNLWNRITTALSDAVLPEPESKKINNNSDSGSDSSSVSSCSEDDDDDGDVEEDNNVQINSEKNLSKTKVKKEKRIKSTTKRKTTDPPHDDDLILDENSKKWAVIAVRVSKYLMWLLTYIGFLKIGFGAVFFVISALLFIYYNTETRRKKRKNGEKSAYSVFNKNCESINGSLDAKQLEKQMVFGNFLG